jgi:hypothetical protein
VSPEQIAEAKAMYESGMTLKAIAAHFGVSRHFVTARLVEAGVGIRNRSMTTQEHQSRIAVFGGELLTCFVILLRFTPRGDVRFLLSFDGGGMRRIAIIMLAAVLGLGVGMSTASADTVSSSGTKSCGGSTPYGDARGSIIGSWTNKPPGNSAVFSGTVSGTSSKVISKVASIQGGGAWRITSSSILGGTSAFCQPS